MDYITINQAFTVVIPMPESQSGNTVTYTVYKASDASIFASGNAAFVAGINWKLSFTPNVEDTFIVEVYNQTLDVRYSQSLKAVRNATMTASIPTVPAATDAEMLVKVNAAISAFLDSGAQSYTINGRTFQRPDIDKLFNLRQKLEIAIANKSGGARNYAGFDR